MSSIRYRKETAKGDSKRRQKGDIKETKKGNKIKETAKGDSKRRRQRRQYKGDN